MPSLTSAATTVAESGFASEASWNTVSASTLPGLPDLAHAEPAEIDHLVLVDDGDGEPGHLALGDHVFRQLLELRDGRHDLLLGSRLGQGRRAEREQGQAERRCAKARVMGRSC